MACFALPQQATAQNSATDVIVSIDDASVGEGDDSVTLTARFSRTVSQDVTLGITYQDGTATFVDDVSGDPAPPRIVTIEANTLSVDFRVFIRNDTVNEPEETLTVTVGGISLPSGETFVFDGSHRATLTIIDDDDPPPPVNNRVSIVDPQPISEGAGSLNFVVSTQFNVNSDVVLGVAYAGGTTNPATPADDLGSDRPATVTIAEGERRATLRVPIINDAIVEGNETFTVALSLPDDNPPGHTLFLDANEGEATGTINDNDEEPGTGTTTTSIRIADVASVAEDGTARFTITLEPQALTSVAVLDVAYAPGPPTGGTQSAIPEEDLGRDRPATVRIPAGSRSVVLEVPIADDDEDEGREAFTVTISAAEEQPDDPETGRPPDVVLLFPDGNEATGIITDDDDAAVPSPARRLSVLIGPRLVGAGTALRRHVGRFDRMTGTVVRNRLDGRAMKTLTASQDLGSGAVAVGGSFDQDRLDQGNWGAWIDGAWAGFDGKATGRQADIHGGVDYLAPNGAGLIGNWLIGALIGHEVADLDIGRATYRSRYTHVGVYGGARLWQHLLFDGAVSYGRATPDIALGDVSASHDAHRFTARGALTGDFGLAYGLWAGSVRIEPQLGLLYSRERLGAFTDSAGGVAGRETLELGRFSAGPRLTWAFDGGRLTGGARMQWDFLQLEDGVDGRVSGAADIGVTLDLAPNVTLGVQGDVDGIGIGDGFGSLGGTVELKARF